MYKNIVYTAKSLIRYVAHKLDFCIAAYAQIVGSAKRHISRLYAVVKVPGSSNFDSSQYKKAPLKHRDTDMKSSFLCFSCDIRKTFAFY